jgi:murein tripeptide amidase MpaA
MGMIKFLLNGKDLRAYLLRKLFVFMIVPMLNPDGVFEGNYRMDMSGRNLNRLYTNPDFTTEYVTF